MEASQENIGDELLRDENISIDDNSENVDVGLLDVWDGEKRARLLQEALPQLDRLFRNSDN